MTPSEILREAMNKVYNELSSMSCEEFKEELKKHENGDIAQILIEAWKIVNPREEEERFFGQNFKNAIRVIKRFRGKPSICDEFYEDEI